MDTIKAAKDISGLPVLPKVSPFRDTPHAAEAAQNAGTDGIVAVNSFGPALGIDIEHGGRLWMGGKGYGRISEAALKPIALRVVYDIARTVEIPVIGVGGIQRRTDVPEFLILIQYVWQVPARCRSVPQPSTAVRRSTGKLPPNWIPGWINIGRNPLMKLGTYCRKTALVLHTGMDLRILHRYRIGLLNSNSCPSAWGAKLGM